MSPKKREHLFIAGLFVLLAVFIIIVNVVVPEKTSTRLIAKVRYFDGSLDTLEISGYSTAGSCVRLRTLDGRQTILGANNVIIIEEVEDQ